jgi:hypothetical protein
MFWIRILFFANPETGSRQKSQCGPGTVLKVEVDFCCYRTVQEFQFVIDEKLLSVGFFFTPN